MRVWAAFLWCIVGCLRVGPAARRCVGRGDVGVVWGANFTQRGRMPGGLRYER